MPWPAILTHLVNLQVKDTNIYPSYRYPQPTRYPWVLTRYAFAARVSLLHKMRIIIVNLGSNALAYNESIHVSGKPKK